jgi:predicted RNA-binding Zn ribbon-like protein
MGEVIERWSWLGEPLAIDFANTLRRHGLEYVEYLGSPRELVEWARHEGVALSGRDVGSRLAEVHALRDAVFALLLDATHGSDVAPARVPSGASARREAESRLNAALAAVPLVPQLRDGAVVLTAPREAPALDALLARIAASALDVLRDPALSFCDAPSCGQFFLRHRGDQRWCGPACGTRARVARHAAHHRDRKTL